MNIPNNTDNLQSVPETAALPAQAQNRTVLILSLLTVIFALTSAFLYYRLTLQAKNFASPTNPEPNSAEVATTPDTSTTADSVEAANSKKTTPMGEVLKKPSTNLTPSTLSKEGMTKNLRRVSYLLDHTKYIEEYEPKNLQNGREVSSINIKSSSKDERYLLQIKDLTDSEKYSPTALIEEMIYTAGGEYSNPVVNQVTANGKNFPVTASVFGDGGPDEENMNCFSGGGVVDYSFKLTPEIGVFFYDYFTEKGCDNNPTVTRTHYLSGEILQDVKDILKSIEVK